MSYHLIDLTKEDTNFSFENVVIGRKIPSDTSSSKYYMYYNHNNIINEMYIRLPKLRLIYPMGNNKYQQIKVPIYPNWEVTNNFIEFIQNLEKDIMECFENKKIKKELSSLISKKNNFYFIKTNMNDNIKITSNTNNMITLNDFKINGEIEMVLKVGYIWTNNNKIGLSSQLYQIKYYAPPEQLNIDFIDNIIIPIIITDKQSIPVKINDSKVVSNIEIKKEVSPIKMVPSMKDLQNALKGLKKI